MSIRILMVLMVLIAAPALPQRQAPTINTESPDGQSLQQAVEEPDEAKRLALFEQFIAKYPSHEGVPWVYSLMIPIYGKIGQFDKAIASAEKILAVDPGDLQTALAALKAAESKKDAGAVRKWATQASDAARKVAGSPKPAALDEDDYRQRVDLAKQLDTYTEYSLYAAGLQASDPKQKADLFRTLEERSPASQYVSQSYGPHFLALTQAGDAPGALALAERVIAKGDGNEEMLAFAGDFYLRQGKEFDKVTGYSQKLIEMANSKPKPEGVGDGDWQKRKNQLLGLGYWMTGAVQSLQNKFADADKTLRIALPNLEGNDELKAGALFHLGVANYKLGNILDAMKFTQQCVSMKGPYQAMAQKNMKAINSEYRIQK